MRRLCPLVLLLLAGCPSGEPTAQSDPSATSSSAVPSPAPSSSPPSRPATGPVAFDNEEHGFALQLPSGWELAEGEAPAKGEPVAAEDPTAMKVLQDGETELLAARRKRGAQVIRLSARHAPVASPKAQLDGYFGALRKGLAEGDRITQSGRANVVMGGRPFTTVRLTVVKRGVQQLLFVTESKKGTLMFSFTARSGAELNEMGRLFKTIRFAETSP